MRNDQYFKHDAGASGNQKIMRLIDELGMKGYGAYWMLQETLRMQSNYRASMNTIKRIAHRARVMPAFLMRIISNYGLFVVEEDHFYSPGMMRRMRAYDATTTRTLHHDAPLECPKPLTDSENIVPNARKEEKKERREEKKKEKKKEEILRQDENKILRQAQDDTPLLCHPDPSPCHSDPSLCHPEPSLCHPERSEGSQSPLSNESKLPPLEVRSFVNGTDHWQEYIDQAFIDRSWLEVVAMHSGLGAEFMPRLPEIRDFFKRHVRTYGKEQSICSVADAKSYFGNFVRQGMPTQKALLAELAQHNAQQAQHNPYRYEEHAPAMGQRSYCGGMPIPTDAPPRPNAFAVWDEGQKRWTR